MTFIEFIAFVVSLIALTYLNARKKHQQRLEKPEEEQDEQEENSREFMRELDPSFKNSKKPPPAPPKKTEPQPAPSPIPHYDSKLEVDGRQLKAPVEQAKLLRGAKSKKSAIILHEIIAKPRALQNYDANQR